MFAFVTCCVAPRTPRKTVVVVGGRGCAALTAAAAARRGAHVHISAAPPAVAAAAVNAAVYAVGAGNSDSERTRWAVAVAHFRSLRCTNAGFFVVRTLLCAEVVQMLRASQGASWAVLRPGALVDDSSSDAEEWKERALLTDDVNVNGRVSRAFVAEVLAELCVDEVQARNVAEKDVAVGVYDRRRLISRPARVRSLVSF